MFPPKPDSFRGRDPELKTLARICRASASQRLALVGTGGSGKSTLACALGHHVSSRYPGGIEWFRVGGWDQQTLLDMVAIRLRIPRGVDRDRAWRIENLRRHLAARGPMLIVLDNHEDDRAMAKFLNALGGLTVTWVLTARRCLLSGVSVFPVVAPLVTAGRNPFPRVAELTKLLRWNPLALDISNALVTTGAITAPALRGWLLERGVDRVTKIEHEDDLPEVRLLVDWVWPRLDAPARRIMAVLAHQQGDHVDDRSLATLAGVRAKAGPLGKLRAWHLVQEPLEERYALHATVRHAVLRRTRFDQRRAVKHYVRLLEAQPKRLDLEQTHLFAAMDHAHVTSDLELALRVNSLLAKLGLE
ncbi:MAG TPA: hypothetical protein VGP07_14145 [Polyangia bacterium]|jgi:hypothetical protein